MSATRFKRCPADALGAATSLTAQEASIFSQRFLERLPLDVVANCERISRERVRQIEQRAAAKVRYLLCKQQFRAASK